MGYAPLSKADLLLWDGYYNPLGHLIHHTVTHSYSKHREKHFFFEKDPEVYEIKSTASTW